MNNNPTYIQIPMGLGMMPLQMGVRQNRPQGWRGRWMRRFGMDKAIAPLTKGALTVPNWLSMGIPDFIDIWQRLTGFAPIYVSQFAPNRLTVSMQIKSIGDKSAINGQIGDKTEENIAVEQKLSAIIEYMQNHSSVTVSEIAAVLSIKASRTRDYLRLLVERGVLVAKGANKNRTYVLKRW